MILLIAATLALIFAAIPAALYVANLLYYRSPPRTNASISTPVSVLIPARNEEASIGGAIQSVLASNYANFELIVLDDHSDDRTAEIVQEYAGRDARVSMLCGAELPEGWSGKQYACAQLAAAAKYPLLVFMDADVQLAPDGLGSMVAFMEQSPAGLASGIPLQRTVGLMEKLVIPLIHFILLGFLPMRRMRSSTDPSYGAGCGQLFIARRDAYNQCGGHHAIRDSFHDGIQLPRAFRKSGILTDLFDATQVATCRMYQSSAALWNGLAKNAREGLASPKLLLPVTALLLTGQVLPVVLLFFTWHSAAAFLLAAGAACLSYLPRIIGGVRFRQSWLGALSHPIGVILLLSIQWYAVLRETLGYPLRWKGRVQNPGSSPDVPIPASMR